MAYKCVTLVGLLIQATSALPPTCVVWHPQQASMPSGFTALAQFTEMLSPRERRRNSRPVAGAKRSG